MRQQARWTRRNALQRVGRAATRYSALDAPQRVTALTRRNALRRVQRAVTRYVELIDTIFSVARCDALQRVQRAVTRSEGLHHFQDLGAGAGLRFAPARHPHEQKGTNAVLR
jgi:hypothetical protein